MDGIETSKLIKERFNIPVIFLTAFSDEHILERAKMTEPFGYILKPFQTKELRITIELALYKASMEKKLREANAELEKALAEIKTLRGIIPICSECKKIRGDTGIWNQIEEYIESCSDASFSHGICPDCTEKLYGEEEWYKKRHKKK